MEKAFRGCDKRADNDSQSLTRTYSNNILQLAGLTQGHEEGPADIGRADRARNEETDNTFQNVELTLSHGEGDMGGQQGLREQVANCWQEPGYESNL